MSDLVMQTAGAPRTAKVLVVGGGGREHALAWKLAQSPHVAHVFVAPGNAGTKLDSRLTNLPITDAHALADWAQQQGISLTVVGPEQPLSQGIVDVFRERGLRIFGPTQAAAQLESSKAFSKDFMQRHGIPTAAYQTFTDAAAAKAYVQRQSAPIVIKADGLAAGKGVVVAQTVEEALAAIDHMLVDKAYAGAAANDQAKVVIEEFLAGEEASFIVVCDGRNALALATSQDHKRLLDGDLGPNTGGMGAYSPAPVVTPDVHQKAMQEVILPTLAGMASDGIPYTGFLYAGLMIVPDGSVKTLEFNCRMGDPETQPIMMRLQSDLYEVLMAATGAGVVDQVLGWDPRVALGVVMAAGGYPQQVHTGDVISGLPSGAQAMAQSDWQVFHAGTRLVDGEIHTAGGRVLCVTALGETVAQAQQQAYNQVRQIHWTGVQWRSDIGHRALATMTDATAKGAQANHLPPEPASPPAKPTWVAPTLAHTQDFRPSPFAHWLFRTLGWTLDFKGLPGAQGIFVVYPHTSNWDFVMGFIVKWALGLQAKFWIKHTTLAVPILGAWLKSVGGVGVNRAAAQGLVGQTLDQFKAAQAHQQTFWLVVTPEGTRSKTKGWKSGFYQIAVEANLPVALVKFDFAKRHMDISQFVHFSGDPALDVPFIQAHYAGVQGCRPDQASPIGLNVSRKHKSNQ